MRPSAPMRRAFACLPAREQLILRRRYLEGVTLERVGLELGISRSRVQQLQSQAENRLARILLGRPLERSLRPPRCETARSPGRDRIWVVWRRRARRPEPFGTLDEILDALEVYPLDDKQRIIESALALGGLAE